MRGADTDTTVALSISQLHQLLPLLLPEATADSVAYASAALLACPSNRAADSSNPTGPDSDLTINEMHAAIAACAAVERALRDDAAAAVRPLRQAAVAISSSGLELVRAFSAAAVAAAGRTLGGLAGAQGGAWVRRQAQEAGGQLLPWERVPGLLSSLHPSITVAEVRLLLAVLAGLSQGKGHRRGTGAGGGGPSSVAGVSLTQLKQALASVVEAQAFPVGVSAKACECLLGGDFTLLHPVQLLTNLYFVPALALQTPEELQQQQEAAAVRQAQLAAAVAADDRPAGGHVRGSLPASEDGRRASVDRLRQNGQQRRLSSQDQIEAPAGAEAGHDGRGTLPNPAADSTLPAQQAVQMASGPTPAQVADGGPQHLVAAGSQVAVLAAQSAASAVRALLSEQHQLNSAAAAAAAVPGGSTDSHAAGPSAALAPEQQKPRPQQQSLDDPLTLLIQRAEHLKQAMQQAAVTPAGGWLLPPLPPSILAPAPMNAARPGMSAGSHSRLSAATEALLQAARALQQAAEATSTSQHQPLALLPSPPPVVPPAPALRCAALRMPQPAPAAGTAQGCGTAAPGMHSAVAAVAAGATMADHSHVGSVVACEAGSDSDSDPAELAGDVILQELFLEGSGSRDGVMDEEKQLQDGEEGLAGRDMQRAQPLVLSVQMSALSLSAGSMDSSVRCVVKPLAGAGTPGTGSSGRSSSGDCSSQPVQLTLPASPAGASRAHGPSAAVHVDLPVPARQQPEQLLLPPYLFCELWTHSGRLLGLVRAPLLLPGQQQADGCGALVPAAVCAGRLQVWDPLEGVEAGRLQVAVVLKVGSTCMRWVVGPDEGLVCNGQLCQAHSP